MFLCSVKYVLETERTSKEGLMSVVTRPERGGEGERGIAPGGDWALLLATDKMSLKSRCTKHSQW